ncbi:hypothetical protein [Solitalea lacus]|uniref:hypothetical protein n=1 Tax=Solitalea lacus TaxID=2911172 RepID=UPI001ED9E79E|nr:hypothetical protein [Solitalea lacus]UKJ07995.1 hypothetical protein L2B55_02225 [Solitalea lacus]
MSLSGILFLVFLITQIPFAVLHHHDTDTSIQAASTDIAKCHVVKECTEASSCLICHFHFVKDFLVEKNFSITVHHFVYKVFATENLSPQLFNLALKELRGPPALF